MSVCSSRSKDRHNQRTTNSANPDGRRLAAPACSRFPSQSSTPDTHLTKPGAPDLEYLVRKNYPQSRLLSRSLASPETKGVQPEVLPRNSGDAGALCGVPHDSGGREKTRAGDLVTCSYSSPFGFTNLYHRFASARRGYPYRDPLGWEKSGDVCIRCSFPARMRQLLCRSFIIIGHPFLFATCVADERERERE